MHERPGFHVYRRSGAFGPARVVPQAIAATSDEAALALLAGAAVDFQLATLIAVEDTDALGGADTPRESAGTITRHERPRRGRIEIDINVNIGGEGGAMGNLTPAGGPTSSRPYPGRP